MNTNNSNESNMSMEDVIEEMFIFLLKHPEMKDTVIRCSKKNKQLLCKTRPARSDSDGIFMLSSAENFSISILCSIFLRIRCFSKMSKMFWNIAKIARIITIQAKKVELLARFELATSSLPRMRSTD